MTAMTRAARAIAWLTLAVLFASCTVYKIKELSPKAIATKGGKTHIVAVQTEMRKYTFRGEEPARIVDGAVVGKFQVSVGIDPIDIAEATRVKKRAQVVMKDGTRYEVVASRPSGEHLVCDALVPVCIPLEDVLRAETRVTDAGLTVLSTIGGVVILPILLIQAVKDEDSLGGAIADEMMSSLFDALIDPPFDPAPRRSRGSHLAAKEPLNVAEGTEFWILEWVAVAAAPDEHGKVRVRLDNPSGAPRGVDAAKLIVVDHPPGAGVAPDAQGIVRALAGPVAPARAVDRTGRDILPLVVQKDASFWRSPGGDPAPGTSASERDELIFEFPRPAGARRARLIVNAANTMWPAEFAREILARGEGAAPGKVPKPAYRENDFIKLGVGLETVFGWQTGQVIFAGGPLPAENIAYGLDLGDVKGPTVRIKIEPPAGFWIIDYLALDFGMDAAPDAAVVDVENVENVDGPAIAEILHALLEEDGADLFLLDPGAESVLTFTAPPPKAGMERTLFLRTVSRYEMTPPRK
jgi:hypothetical protein